jgi:hypothetical protein
MAFNFTMGGKELSVHYLLQLGDLVISPLDDLVWEVNLTGVESQA